MTGSTRGLPLVSISQLIFCETVSAHRDIAPPPRPGACDQQPWRDRVFSLSSVRPSSAPPTPPPIVPSVPPPTALPIRAPPTPPAIVPTAPSPLLQLR